MKLASNRNSSYVATDSLRYVKFNNLRKETIILGGIGKTCAQKPFLLGPQKQTVSRTDFSVRYAVLYTAQEGRKIVIDHC